MIRLFSWQKYIKIINTIVARWVEGVSLPFFLLSMNVLVSMVNKETIVYGLRLPWVIFILTIIVFV
jgi:hypothetical protein